MDEICEKMSFDLNIYKNGQMASIGGQISFANNFFYFLFFLGNID